MGPGYQNGQYSTQTNSTVSRYEYPPSDPTSFQPTTYDSTGYFSADGHYGLPLDAQHQQSLVSDPSTYLRYDDSIEHYDAVTQHSVMSIPPSSTSSELGNAIIEIRSSEHQQMGRTSIALPSLPPQTAPKHDSSEGAVVVKTEFGAIGQAFSPMTPLDSPSRSGGHASYIKEEEQEQLHLANSSMPRRSSLHGHGSHPHRQHALDSFRLVQDPTAFPEFASSNKVRSCLTIAYRLLILVLEARPATALIHSWSTPVFPWCAYLYAALIVVLFFRYGDTYVDHEPDGCHYHVVIAPYDACS
jgi:hypothetical protein